MDSEEDFGGEALVISMCSKKKALERGPAKYVYGGTLVRLVSNLVLKLSANWLILSAKYGLINSNEVIESYDTYLLDLTQAERERLKDLVRSKCKGLKAKVIITVLSKYYATLLDCDLRADIAIVVGHTPPGLSAKEIINLKPKGIGQYYKALKVLEECGGKLEEFVRCVKKRIRNGDVDFVELQRMGRNK